MLRQSEDRYLAMIVDVQSQVRAARANSSTPASKPSSIAIRSCPSKKNLMHQTELQYNGMYVGVFELLQAKRNQVEATRQYLESLRDYWTARAQLEQAIASRLPSAGATTKSGPQP